MAQLWFNAHGGPNTTVTEPQPYNKIGDGPELPEILLTSEELHEALVGKLLISSQLGPRAKHARMDQLPSLLPSTFKQITSHGKKIIFNMVSNEGVEYQICSALLMSGHWGWSDDKNHIHLTFGIGVKLDENSLKLERYLYFDDTRHFGNNTLILNDQQREDYFKSVGVDLYREADKVTPEFWRSKVRYGRIRTKQICAFLMEQKYFAGVGNYLKAEILYRCKIRPDRSLESLSDAEVESLRVMTLELIRESYKSKGLTIKTYYTPNGLEGKFECQVYGQKFDPLGNEVIKSTFKDNRVSHWVVSVQK